VPGSDERAWQEDLLPEAAVHAHDQAASPGSSVHWRDLEPHFSSYSDRPSTSCCETLQPCTVVVAPPPPGATAPGVAGAVGEAGPEAGCAGDELDPPQAGRSVNARASHGSVRFMACQTAPAGASDGGPPREPQPASVGGT
jgi:hypothetical protein